MENTWVIRGKKKILKNELAGPLNRTANENVEEHSVNARKNSRKVRESSRKYTKKVKKEGSFELKRQFLKYKKSHFSISITI